MLPTGLFKTASFMEAGTSNKPPKSSLTSLPSPTGSLYQTTFSCRAATKEIQRVIDTINDGTLYLRGPVRIRGIRILRD